jgi:hypothetical protein
MFAGTTPEEYIEQVGDDGLMGSLRAAVAGRGD